VQRLGEVPRRRVIWRGGARRAVAERGNGDGDEIWEAGGGARKKREGGRARGGVRMGERERKVRDGGERGRASPTTSLTCERIHDLFEKKTEREMI
jgi:hypothetical protein